MSPEEARRELRLALTRGRRAHKKVSGGLGGEHEVLVMLTEEVAVALLADGYTDADSPPSP
jgi:hypothetical protein